MKPTLGELLGHSGLWRSREFWSLAGETVPSGIRTLDACLPGGGWPVGALTEILCDGPGSGELQLVVYSLVRLSREGRWVAWIAPPLIPYAPALVNHGIALSRVLLVRPDSSDQGLWAAEQALRAAACGAVLVWSSTANERGLRRLQLAAESGHSCGVLFRPSRLGVRTSPAALRLRLESTVRGLEVQVLKCRGRAPGAAIVLPRDFPRDVVSGSLGCVRELSMPGRSGTGEGEADLRDVSAPGSPGVQPAHHLAPMVYTTDGG